MANVSPNGDSNNNSFLRAMLQFRYTPDSDCDLSPAKIVFGRPCVTRSFLLIDKLSFLIALSDANGERLGEPKNMLSICVQNVTTPH